MKNKHLILLAGLVSLVGVSPSFGDERYEGETVAKEIIIQGQNTEWEIARDVSIQAPIYRVTETTELEWKLETTWDYECTSEPGEGRGDWKGYFNVPRRDKADRLADAIKGIGKATAEKIVADGSFFTRKPRSWKEFKAEIGRIQDRLGGNISYEVIVKYGQENARNLGYVDETSCSEVPNTVLVPRLVVREHRDFSHAVTMSARYLVRGLLLLPSEKAELRVSFNGSATSVRMNTDAATCNPVAMVSSSFENGQTVSTYSMDCMRKFKRPEATLNVNLWNEGGEAKMEIKDWHYAQVDPSFLGEATVVVELYEKKGVFTRDVKLGGFEKKLDGASAVIVATGIRPAQGIEVYARYALKRIGSRVYDGGLSESKETYKVKF